MELSKYNFHFPSAPATTAFTSLPEVTVKVAPGLCYFLSPAFCIIYNSIWGFLFTFWGNCDRLFHFLSLSLLQLVWSLLNLLSVLLFRIQQIFLPVHQSFLSVFICQCYYHSCRIKLFAFRIFCLCWRCFYFYLRYLFLCRILFLNCDSLFRPSCLLPLLTFVWLLSIFVLKIVIPYSANLFLLVHQLLFPFSSRHRYLLIPAGQTFHLLCIFAFTGVLISYLFAFFLCQFFSL